MVAQQDGAGADLVLLGEFVDGLLLEQGAARAAQGAVGGDVDALGLAKVDNLLLRAVWVVLNLGCISNWIIRFKGHSPG